jgi:CelD/BcsL family acetyltransferase involved in cellulose biosynthesis
MHTLEQITELGQFESLRGEWDDLLRCSNADCVFLTWEWLFTWWRFLSAGRQLCLVAVREDGLLVALAPFARRPPDLRRFVPSASLEFLGTGAVGSDYLDIIARRGYERSALPLITQWAAANGTPITLDQLPALSAAAAVARSLQELGWSVRSEMINVCPYIMLAGHTWESYLNSLSASQRYGLRRQMRNLEKHSRVSLETVASESDRRGALEQLWKLHRARWDTRGGSDALPNSAVLAFHDAFTELALLRGWLRLYTLRIDGRATASLYGLRYGTKFLFYQSGFDPALNRNSVGMITLALVIERAIQEDAAEFDMLHGGEQYKKHWANASRDLVRLETYPPHPLGQLCLGGVRLNRWSRRMARALLPTKIAAHLAAITNR